MDDGRVERLVQLRDGVADDRHEPGGQARALGGVCRADDLGKRRPRDVLHDHDEPPSLLAHVEQAREVAEVTARPLRLEELAVGSAKPRTCDDELADEGSQLAAALLAQPRELGHLAWRLLEHALHAVSAGRRRRRIAQRTKMRRELVVKPVCRGSSHGDNPSKRPARSQVAGHRPACPVLPAISCMSRALATFDLLARMWLACRKRTPAVPQGSCRQLPNIPIEFAAVEVRVVK